ncbi:hypothetical protein H257_14220 [Aphanomyces astaci]|uniref:Transposase Tc1-like domain-containing protein n=1 Tax=Aphanomyces astaci TaxID=112090 RepID=W4FRT8_APHAT|nr:hypothetical protein H257_14220 [Aphanomyces astaci]ETV70187.1 hypothetical protein H257_14220 [Aphanomyces astaci]|eukprot:XP_009840283.1 hypothetical protein H257_14220 [Aphanomyces astaci]
MNLLLACLREGKLPHGSFQFVAGNFGVTRFTIRLIWLRAQVDLNNDQRICVSVASQKVKCGRKLKHDDISSRLKELSKTSRTTMRAVAAGLGIPTTALHAYYKRGAIVKYSSYVKPALTDANKVARLKWALDHVIGGSSLHFKNLMDTRTLYLAPGEKPPHRQCKSKRFITKVMFLSAVARPRWNNNTGEWFDGKLGTWHFTEMAPVMRSSRNRPAGTMELKTKNVDKTAYRQMLVYNAIPAIRAKLPAGETKCVKIQQDNARPHVSAKDPTVAAAYKADAWDMEIVCQPPNSPDMNVLDLGFFRAIQTLQERHNCLTVQDVVAATEAACNEVSMETLDSNFMTLQSCLQEVIKATGDNNYKIPHMGKKKLALAGKLPETIACDPTLLNRDF